MDSLDVTWVGSQCTNPALCALIKEAERDKKSRLPVDEPFSCSYPFAATPALSASTSSLPPPERRPQRKAQRPRSSSNTPTQCIPHVHEPQAERFLSLLQDVADELDQNALKKQRIVARARRDARPLIKASSASSIPDFGLSRPQTRPLSKLAPPKTSPDGDVVMHDVIDLTETDTESDGPTSRRMQIDDDHAMDLSFVRLPPLKPIPPRPSTARPRTGPPPLGMRRAPQLPVSQKSATGSRFKPPLLANGGGATTKSGTSKLPTRAKVAVAELASQANQDPDSSFDLSFDMDPDALEEAMKAYD